MNVRPRIKNCGLRRREEVQAAAASGASFAGFIHAEGSPRHLARPALSALMAESAGLLPRVIVLRNPPDALLDALPRPEFWQVHDIRDPRRIAAIGERYGLPLITALSHGYGLTTAQIQALEEVSAHLLFDSAAPGSGQRLDAAAIPRESLRKPWFLAGGLTAGNVAEAIRLSGAPMVDVSSGIESAPGVKSLEMIAEFNRAVLGAAA